MRQKTSDIPLKNVHVQLWARRVLRRGIGVLPSMAKPSMSESESELWRNSDRLDGDRERSVVSTDSLCCSAPEGAGT